MSNRRITWFYALLIAMTSAAAALVIASRLGLSPESSAQTVAAPPMNSAPHHRPLTATTFRDIAKTRQPGRRQHPHRVAAARAGPERFLRRQRSVRSLLRSAGTAAAASGGGRTATARAGRAGRRHRLHHRQGRLHPHQQPRRRRRDRRSRSRSTARTTTRNTTRRSSAAIR